MPEVLLASTFEGGYQPLTLASAATPLVEAGFPVSVLDTYVNGVDTRPLEKADLIAISLPIFDSVQSGLELARQARTLNPDAHITFFGQHATIHAFRLVGKYGDSSVAGEWELPLVGLARRAAGDLSAELPGVITAVPQGAGDKPRHFISRTGMRVPSRHLLPPLTKYPQIQLDKLLGAAQVVGSTEIARGCHHTCLYCSVFAAYDGKVVIVPEPVILQDVQNLFDGGITHRTLIDAGFSNPRHYGVRILRQLRQRFPDLTYDMTTRVDHIVENKDMIREMGGLGMRVITSALEFPSQKVLDALNKEVTVEQVEEAVIFLRQAGIKLNPTFIMFNPWIGLEDLVQFHRFCERTGLDQLIDPIQYETRLYLYKGSPLLQLPAVKALELQEHEFHYEWKHPDPRVDELFLQSVTPAQEGVFKRCCLKC